MKNTDRDTAARKRQAAEKLWLLYFNQTLFEKGMITERDRNRMIHKIDSRTSSHSSPRSPG